MLVLSDRCSIEPINNINIIKNAENDKGVGDIIQQQSHIFIIAMSSDSSSLLLL